MLAEKFFLVLETIRSHASDDKSPDGRPSPVVTTPVPQIPIKPRAKSKSRPPTEVAFWFSRMWAFASFEQP
jgi:hypothetical protein